MQTKQSKIYNSRNSKDLIVAPLPFFEGNLIYNSRNSKDLIVEILTSSLEYISTTVEIQKT